MLEIKCPYCGKRSQNEFSYGGDASVKRPQLGKEISSIINSGSLVSDDIVERLVETYLAYAPRGFKQFLFSMPIWLKDKLFMKRQIINSLKMVAINGANLSAEKAIIALGCINTKQSQRALRSLE